MPYNITPEGHLVFEYPPQTGATPMVHVRNCVTTVVCDDDNVAIQADCPNCCARIDLVEWRSEIPGTALNLVATSTEGDVQLWCEDCYDNDTHECEGCGNRIDASSAYSSHGDIYCQDCYNEVTEEYDDEPYVVYGFSR